MFFKQFHLESLGHASYLVGSDDTGEALVFDPQRRVDGYLTSARDQGLRIGVAPAALVDAVLAAVGI